MNDRTLTRVGVAGRHPRRVLLRGAAPRRRPALAGFGAWLAGAGMVILSFMLAAFALIAWGIHHRRATPAAHESAVHKESVKP